MKKTCEPKERIGYMQQCAYAWAIENGFRVEHSDLVLMAGFADHQLDRADESYRDPVWQAAITSSRREQIKKLWKRFDELKK